MIYRPGPYDNWRILNLWSNGQPVDSLELGIVDLPYLLISTIRAHRIDPGDEFAQAKRIDLNILVFAAHRDIDQLARIG